MTSRKKKPTKTPEKKAKPLLRKATLTTHAAKSNIPLYVVLAGTSLLFLLTFFIFKNSAYTGRYDLKNTFSLYASIFAAGCLLCLYAGNRWRKVLLFNWSAIILVIVLLEAYLRLSDTNNILNYSEKNEGYFTTNVIQYQKSLDERNKGNQLYLNTLSAGPYMLRKPEYEYHYTLDSLGLNNCKSCYNRNNGLSILTLGDSFTWGMGAEEGKSWPHQLESILLSEGYRDIRICNGGVQGPDPVYMLDALKLVYEKQFSPDLLIVAINPSDIMDIVIRGGMDRYTLNKPAIEHKKWLPFYASSLLFRLYMRTIKHIDPELLVPEEWKSAMIYNAYTQLFETMLSIRQYQAMRGKETVFVYTPIMLDILNGYSALRDILQEAEVQGMRIIDATQTFLRNGVSLHNLDQYFWPIDAHNTEKGYALIARAVSEYLISHSLIAQN